MISSKTYNTKQKNRINIFLKNSKNTNISVSDIIKYFQKTDSPIGTATIYRYVANLEKQGFLKKHINKDRIVSYQYNGDNNCDNYYFLKCLCCGKLTPLTCNFMTGIDIHLSKQHNFIIDTSETVLYGYCEPCHK